MAGITRVEQLEHLLSVASRQVVAFDPTGATVQPMPEALECAAEVLDIDSPLDSLSPISQGKAVALFEQARRHGSADGAVTLADGETPAQLHLYDLAEQYGVFVAVLTETDNPGDAGTSASTLLPPKRWTNKLSPTGLVLDVDDQFTKALGWTAEEAIGTSSMDRLHPDDHEAAIVNWAELLDNPGGARRLRQRMLHKEGHWVWVEATDTNLLAHPDDPCVFVEIVDISDEMTAVTALHQREALLARVTEALPTGILHVEADGTVVFANARWWEITGLAEGSSIAELLEVVSDPATAEAAIETASGGIVDVDLDVTISHPEVGAIRHGRLGLRPLDPTTPGSLLLALEDTTEATALRHRLADEARRDPLTGLLNRAGIMEHLDAVLDGPHDDHQVAVLYLDLDRFKLINDQHSHATGDEVLCAVADKLTEVLRPGDHVGRLGGDEFLMILSEVAFPDDAYAIAQRLEREIDDLSLRWDAELAVAGSVGVALAGANEPRDALVNRADAVMYDRKAARAAG